VNTPLVPVPPSLLKGRPTLNPKTAGYDKAAVDLWEQKLFAAVPPPEAERLAEEYRASEFYEGEESEIATWRWVVSEYWDLYALREADGCYDRTASRAATEAAMKAAGVTLPPL
jgi:hypothetical protein